MIAGSLSEGAPLFDLQGMALRLPRRRTPVSRLEAEAGRPPPSDEARLFVGWQSDFDKRCWRLAGWMSPASSGS